MSSRDREMGAGEPAAAAVKTDVAVAEVATAAGVTPTTEAPAPAAARPAGARADIPAGTTVGEYRVEGRLGAGAFGTVYAAVQPLIGKRVAIKVLDMAHSVDPGMVARFVAEARAVNVIGHENIVDIFSFGELEDGRRYFVMERLDGRPLSSLLKERGPLPVVEALAILTPVARALAAAHEHGIAHRDLKPDNIFLCTVAGGGWRPKLLDFGVAKLLDETSDQHATATGVTVGTPSYMSPEQCVGKGVDHRADIYAFGVLTHRMLGGKLPFHAESGSEMMAKHLYEKPAPLSDVRPELPHGVTHAVLSMLEKDKAKRPQKIEEALASLEAAARGEEPPPRAAPANLPAREVRSTSDTSGATADIPVAGGGRSRTAVLVGGGLLVAVLAVGAVMVLQSPSHTSGTTPAVTAAPAAGSPTPPVPEPAAPPPPATQPASNPQPPVKAEPALPAQVRIDVRGVPAKTRVLDEQGASLGIAPGVIDLPRGEGKRRLSFEARGFDRSTVELVPDHDQPLTVALAASRGHRPVSRPDTSAATPPADGKTERKQRPPARADELPSFEEK